MDVQQVAGGAAQGGIAQQHRGPQTSAPLGFLPAQFDQLGYAQDSLIVARNKLSELGFYLEPSPAPSTVNKPEGETNLRTSLDNRVQSIVDLAKQVQQQVERLV